VTAGRPARRPQGIFQQGIPRQGIPQQGVDDFGKVTPRVRLGHDRIRAFGEMGITARRQDRNGRGGGLASKPPDELGPIHDRHHHVGHHQVGPRLGHRPQRGGSIAGIGNHMTSPLEDPPEQEPMGRFVVNDQDLGQPRRRSPTGCYQNATEHTLKVTTR